MANLSIPYLICRQGAAGALPRYFWQPSSKLRAAGFRPARVPANWSEFHDGDLLQAAAIAAARGLNADVAAAQAAGPSPASSNLPPPALRTLGALLQAYQASTAHAGLREATRARYGRRIATLAAWGGTLPVRSIDGARVQALAASVGSTPALAVDLVAVLRLVLEWGRRNGWVTVNAAIRPGLAGSEPGGVIWPAEAVTAFVATADRLGWHSVGTAVLLNSWLGQREADILAMTRGALRNGALIVRQSKRGAGVALPVDMVPHLVERLAADAARLGADRQVLPLHLVACETTGRAWSADSFRHRFERIRAEAALAYPAGFTVDYLLPGRDSSAPDAFVVHMRDLTFMRLRHTAVTRLAEAECEPGLIASITGHSQATVVQLMARYMVRTAKLARVAFGKRLEAERRAG